MKRLAVLLALVALACDPPFSAPVYVAALRVTPDSANLETGGNVQLTAVATDSAGRTLSGVRVIWTSSVDSLASVSASGLVHCVRPGYVTISAAAQGATGKAALTITVRVTAVRIEQPPLTLVPGGAFPYSAHALDSVGDFLYGRPITWTASDTSVLTVSGGGVAAAHAPGSAFLRVSTGSLRDSVPITVRQVRFVQVVTGEWDHACGVTTDAATYCWGRNELGQLGISSGGAPVPAPVSPSTTPRFATLAVGATFTCGDQSTGVIYCWGSSAGGRLGAGVTTLTTTTPQPVFGSAGLSGPTASWAHACALAGGVPVCWGRNPAAGGTAGVNWVPTVVTPGASFTHIAAGPDFTCALNSDSAAFCWGQNLAGELGSGTVGEGNPVPTAVAGGLRFVQLTGGWYHACGLTSTGAAYCWGSNVVGELGSGDTASLSITPVAVAGDCPSAPWPPAAGGLAGSRRAAPCIAGAMPSPRRRPLKEARSRSPRSRWATTPSAGSAPMASPTAGVATSADRTETEPSSPDPRRLGCWDNHSYQPSAISLLTADG